MNITDPIADMLTRIRNANSSKHKIVDVPASKMKLGIAEILYKEGYIKHYYTKSFEEWTNKSKRGWPDGTEHNTPYTEPRKYIQKNLPSMWNAPSPYLFLGELVKTDFDYNNWYGGNTDYALQ